MCHIALNVWIVDYYMSHVVCYMCGFVESLHISVELVIENYFVIDRYDGHFVYRIQKIMKVGFVKLQYYVRNLQKKTI